jgi:O-antigen ligase
VIVVGIGFYSIYNQTANRIGQEKLNQLWNVKTYKDLERLDLRFTFYSSALKFGLEKLPILGSGSKTFGLEVIGKSEDWRAYNNSFYKEHYFFHAHNALLTIWIEMGWVGLIAVLLFLWLWFRPALRGPPLLMMPMLAVCVGQILDYFVWEIFFMAFQSFFFAHFAATITFQEMDQSSS